MNFSTELQAKLAASCQWCRRFYMEKEKSHGGEPEIMDEHGSLTLITGSPGIWRHASGDHFWACEGAAHLEPDFPSARFDTLPKMLNDLLVFAVAYNSAHKLVEDNPTKLNNARTAEACTRVANECAKNMEIFGKAEEILCDKALEFLIACNNALFRHYYELANGRRKDMAVAFAAMRFAQARIESIGDESKYRSHGPASPQSRRYFDYRDELFQLASQIQLPVKIDLRGDR